MFYRIISLFFVSVVTFGIHAASEPDWVQAMKKVHQGFKGDSVYVAQLGDSITFSMAFWSTVGWTYPDRFLTGDDGLPKKPGEKRWRDIIKGTRAKGPKEGNYSGWRVHNLLKVIDEVLEKRKPAIALIMLGTNDMNAGEGYQKGMETIVKKCMAAHCIPVLNTIPPRRGRMKTVEAINKVIKELAKKQKVPLVDYCKEILKRRPGTTWDGTLISKDGVHPTGADNHDFSKENLKKSGYALRTWVNWCMVRQLYFRVLHPEEAK